MGDDSARRHYHTSNLIGIIDVNRFGQRGETMFGHDIDAYARRVAAFGWKTIEIDGHDISRRSTRFVMRRWNDRSR